MTDSAEASSPLNEFSECHAGILRNFEMLQKLADDYRDGASAHSLRQRAQKLLDFFENVVVVHHAEEEEELFSAVLEAVDDEDSEIARKARSQIRRLVHEHRQLEALWESIEKPLKGLAHGKESDFDVDTAERLAQQYLAHARFEEQVFLPLSSRILGKYAKSALGLSLHLRHLDRVNPYI